MSIIVHARELTAKEIDAVGGGHTPGPPPPPLSEQIAELPDKTVSLVTTVAETPGAIAGNAGTPNGGLLGLGG